MQPELKDEYSMAYVIAELCIGTKDMACVDERREMMFKQEVSQAAFSFRSALENSFTPV
jgi:hypothetical protein